MRAIWAAHGFGGNLRQRNGGKTFEAPLPEEISGAVSDADQ